MLLHVAPVELERQQRDGERVLDQTSSPALGDVVDVQTCGALVQDLPHAVLVVLDEHVIKELAGVDEVAGLAGEQLGDAQAELLVGALTRLVDGLLELDRIGRFPRQALPKADQGSGSPSA